MTASARRQAGEPFLPVNAWIFWLASVAGLIFLALLYGYDPAAEGIFLSCPLNSWTGLYCAGCGTQRALHQLLHGHPVTALGLNALMVMSLPLLLYAWAAQAQRTLGRDWLPPLRFNRWLVSTALVAVVVFALLRNLPWWPFRLLAP